MKNNKDIKKDQLIDLEITIEKLDSNDLLEEHNINNMELSGCCCCCCCDVY